MKKTTQSGFTLMELMFTVAVLAVVLALGIPNFRDFLRNSRMASAANNVITDFANARSEAVKRRVTVTLCKTTDGASCSTDDDDPFERWIIFVDDADPGVVAAEDGNGEVDDDEPILRETTISDTLTVYTNVGGNRAIFETTGFPRTGVENLTNIRICDDRENVVGVGGQSAARAIVIQPTGRAAVTRDVDTIDDLGGCS